MGCPLCLNKYQAQPFVTQHHTGIVYDLVSLQMIVQSVTLAILNEFLILLSLPLCLSLHQKNLIKVLNSKY